MVLGEMVDKSFHNLICGRRGEKRPITKFNDFPPKHFNYPRKITFGLLRHKVLWSIDTNNGRKVVELTKDINLVL